MASVKRTRNVTRVFFLSFVFVLISLSFALFLFAEYLDYRYSLSVSLSPGEAEPQFLNSFVLFIVALYAFFVFAFLVIFFFLSRHSS